MINYLAATYLMQLVVAIMRCQSGLHTGTTSDPRRWGSNLCALRIALYRRFLKHIQVEHWDSMARSSWHRRDNNPHPAISTHVSRRGKRPIACFAIDLTLEKRTPFLPIKQYCISVETSKKVSKFNWTASSDTCGISKSGFRAHDGNASIPRSRPDMARPGTC